MYSRIRIAIIFVSFIGSLFITGCNVSDSDSETWGDWQKVSSFEGVSRSNAAVFTIDGKAYLGTGYDGDERLSDFWQYDPEKNFWTQQADFPGTPRSSAVGFAAGGYGYIGTGYNEDVENDYLKDFWEYNPETNTWQQVADFGGSARYGAVAFSIGGRGYVGTGYDGNYLKDFWRYDPQADQWSQVISIPGEKRIDATTFVIDDTAYVATGQNNGLNVVDFWRYEAEEGWTQLHDIDENEDDETLDIPRSNAVGFTLNDKGYIALGSISGVQSDIWEYDPATGTWSDELANFEGTARKDAAAFAIGSKAYVGIGTNTASYYDDFWSFDPQVLNDEDD